MLLDPFHPPPQNPLTKEDNRKLREKKKEIFGKKIIGRGIRLRTKKNADEYRE